MTDIASDVKGGPAAFYGFMGVAAALTFANIGSAYGTAKSGVNNLNQIIINFN